MIVLMYPFRRLRNRTFDRRVMFVDRLEATEAAARLLAEEARLRRVLDLVRLSRDLCLDTGQMSERDDLREMHDENVARVEALLAKAIAAVNSNPTARAMVEGATP